MANTIENEKPMVTRNTLLSCQVCVPRDWTDKQASDFVNGSNPAGTSNGWLMRRNGDEALAGADERVRCEGRAGFVHIMFDC